MPSIYDEFETVWAPPDTAVADNGAQYSSVQDAVDDATSMVLIGPGTFEENVSNTADDLFVQGVGTASVIDGGDSGRAFNNSGSDVTVKNLAVQTDQGGDDDAIRMAGGSVDFRLSHITVVSSGNHGIYAQGGRDGFIAECKVKNTDNIGIFAAANRVSVSDSITDSSVLNTGVRHTGYGGKVQDCIVNSAGFRGIDARDDDQTVSDNTIIDATTDGIVLAGTNQTVSGNRIVNPGSSSIERSGATNPSLVGNNTDDGIEDNATTWTQTSIDDTDSPYDASDLESVWVDASGGAVTVNAPTPGQDVEFRVYAVDASNTITVSRNGTESINGSASDHEINDTNVAVSFESDSTDWAIV